MGDRRAEQEREERRDEIAALWEAANAQNEANVLLERIAVAVEAIAKKLGADIKVE